MPGVSSKPRSKTTIPPLRWKGQSTRPKGGMGVPGMSKGNLKKALKFQTGGYHRAAWKKAEAAAKRAGKAVKAVVTNPKGEAGETKKVVKSVLKKKPITHVAKRVKASWKKYTSRGPKK